VILILNWKFFFFHYKLFSSIYSCLFFFFFHQTKQSSGKKRKSIESTSTKVEPEGWDGIGDFFSKIDDFQFTSKRSSPKKEAGAPTLQSPSKLLSETKFAPLVDVLQKEKERYKNEFAQYSRFVSAEGLVPLSFEEWYADQKERKRQ